MQVGVNLETSFCQQDYVREAKCCEMTGGKLATFHYLRQIKQENDMSERKRSR